MCVSLWVILPIYLQTALNICVVYYVNSYARLLFINFRALLWSCSNESYQVRPKEIGPSSYLDVLAGRYRNRWSDGTASMWVSDVTAQISSAVTIWEENAADCIIAITTHIITCHFNRCFFLCKSNYSTPTAATRSS